LIFSSNINETMNELIPCEYCAAQISIDDWTSHMVNKQRDFPISITKS
jgi:hypothetical protein